MDELSTQSTTRLELRLLGDVTCPWTYLTLTTIHRAVGPLVALEWHPFLLRPQERVRPGSEAAAAVAWHAADLAAPFRPAGLVAEVDAHLVHGVILAADPELRLDVARHLLAARFAEASQLAAAADLIASLPSHVGADEAAAWVDDAATLGPTIDRADRAARLAGVSAVPLTVVDQTYAIAGLQPAGAFSALADLARIGRRLADDAGPG